jgi:tripartite-type tricarboxylate transporter receptor subunit TctC
MQSNWAPLLSVVDSPMSRRALIRQGGGLAVAAGLLDLDLPARAQTRYPARPLRMLLAFPPAGATDILARIIGQGMSIQLGQAVVVENRPGAGGMIGLEAGAKATADGYNLFLCALTNQAIAGHLYPKATADITRDFETIAMIANGAHILNVHPSVPAKTLPEFISWLKANDGKINYASQGNGTLSHLEAELLQQRAGVTATHVPYKGSSQALPDLLAGNVSFMFDSVAASQPFIQSGKLRPLAVATSKRVPIYPDLPTIAEAGLPGYDADNWFGLYAPKGTPQEILSRLSEELAKVLAEATVLDSLEQKGYVVTYGDASMLATVTASDRAKWGKVIQAANITV